MRLIVKITLLCFFTCTLALVHHLFIPRERFVDKNIRTYSFDIKSGDSIKQLSTKLENDGVISSDWLFIVLIKTLGAENKIKSDTYVTNKPLSLVQLYQGIVKGKIRIKDQKITIPEGSNVIQMSKILEKQIVNFKTEDFVEKAKEKEGYLFPETYFFSPNSSENTIISKLEKTFIEKTAESKKESDSKDKDWEEIIKMASIIEEEVRGLEDKKIVSGIFWKRIEIGMPLQADSTLAYVTGKDSLSLTFADLKTKNPYNSYTNKGLPPTPISNPGLESIEASLNPTPSKYLYFLTDKEGKVYYGKTYAEHLKNRSTYLSK